MPRIRSHGGTRFGAPVVGAAALRVTCPNCAARIGERCRVYKVIDGGQSYIERYRVKFHDERRAPQGGDAT